MPKDLAKALVDGAFRNIALQVHSGDEITSELGRA